MSHIDEFPASVADQQCVELPPFCPGTGALRDARSGRREQPVHFRAAYGQQPVVRVELAIDIA
jgi:hypothetical protein